MCKFKLQKKILGSVFVKICGNEATFLKILVKAS